VRWALEEAWLPCQARLVDFDDLNLDAYRKKQPFGMVPAFEADGLDLSSGAIVHHIATACEALMSTDGAGRAATLTWKGKDGDYRREIPPQPRDGSAVGGSLGWRGAHRRTDGTAPRGSFHREIDPRCGQRHEADVKGAEQQEQQRTHHDYEFHRNRAAAIASEPP